MTISDAARNAACNAIVDLLDAGATIATLTIYDGSQPASPDTALSGQTALAVLDFADPAFGDSASGTATANAIAADDNAVAGTASWARAEFGSDCRTDRPAPSMTAVGRWALIGPDSGGRDSAHARPSPGGLEASL